MAVAIGRSVLPAEMLLLPLIIASASLQRYVFDADLDIERETSAATMVLPGLSHTDLGDCASAAACVQALGKLLDGVKEQAHGVDRIIARANGDTLEIVLSREGDLSGLSTPFEVVVASLLATPEFETRPAGAGDPLLWVTWAASPYSSVTLTATGAARRLLLRYPDQTGFRDKPDDFRQYLIDSGTVHLHVERYELDGDVRVTSTAGWLQDVRGFEKAARAAGLME